MKKENQQEIISEESVKEILIQTNETKQQNSGKSKSKKKKKVPQSAKNYPKHIRNVAFILKNNSEIRRFTSLGIINYLLQKGVIKAENHYVKFLWNKFAVKCNGITKEYAYTEPFFLNCLLASFSCFSASAKKTIDIFIQKEGIEDAICKSVNTDEINKIIASIEEYELKNGEEHEDNNTKMEYSNFLKEVVSAESILFFDMDGTLVNTDYANFLAYKKAIELVIKSNCNLQYNPQNRFNRKTLTEVFPYLNESDYTEIINHKEKYYPQFLSETTPNEEVIDILIKYSATHRTVLVTNCYKERAIATLSYYGLEDKFDEFVFKNKKQNLNKYQYALSKLKIPPNLVIAFENEEKEIINAIKEGIERIVKIKNI